MTKLRSDDEMRALLYERSAQVPEAGCWIWMRSVDPNGYAEIGYKGKLARGHRLSYSLFVGEIPTGLHVLHRCDTRCCVNPHHLDVGTNMDNILDKMRKGRGWVPSGDDHYMRRFQPPMIGEKCPAAKLTTADVLRIRELGAQGIKKPVIAERFGVTRQAVHLIIKRINWKHI